MFNVELSVGDFDGHAVLALCGELDLFDTSDVASHLIAAVAAYGPSIIVDLAGLEFIDSCGLRVLVRALKWTREGGGDLSLAAPQQQARRVLETTGLIDVFSVYPSVEQAVSSARLARPGRPRRCSAGCPDQSVLAEPPGALERLSPALVIFGSQSREPTPSDLPRPTAICSGGFCWQELSIRLPQTRSDTGFVPRWQGR